MTDDKTREAPIFEFSFWAAEADKEGYYHTRWDQAVPIAARGANLQEAINSAAIALGDPRRGRYWTFRTVSSRQVA